MPGRRESSSSSHARRAGRARTRARTQRGRSAAAARARARRRRTDRRVGSAHAAAKRRLRRFRQGSLLAVAITGLFLMLTGTVETPAQQDPAGIVADTTSQDTLAAQAAQAQATAADTTSVDPARSVEEATGTARQLAREFTRVAPKIIIALLIMAAAGVLVRGLRTVLRLALRRWERAEAATAMAGVLIWLLAIGAALSIVAGDVRALVGSVGLLGLALSWALQTPIESFAGWLLNSFKGYYRVGDRIAVGEVFGDVYRIDFLNTTVWEAGGPDKPVQGAQPTGALITFPNSEVLRANITNYTRGFPYVWDEIAVSIDNRSDLAYAMQVILDAATAEVGAAMSEPVRTYRSLLEQERIAYDIAEQPQVFVTPNESWTDVTVRYLVGARERRKWATALHVRMAAVIAQPDHASRIIPAYPSRRVFVESAEEE